MLTKNDSASHKIRRDRIISGVVKRSLSTLLTIMGLLLVGCGDTGASSVPAAAGSLPAASSPEHVSSVEMKNEAARVEASPTRASLPAADATSTATATPAMVTPSPTEPVPTATQAPESTPTPKPTTAKPTTVPDPTGESSRDEPVSGAPILGFVGEPYYGPSLLEERINLSNIIARVRMDPYSPHPTVARLDYGGYEHYVSAMEYEFEVLEYLKGSGDETLSVLVYTYGEFDTESEAFEAAESLLRIHDKRWDWVEAIVFVSDYMSDSDGWLKSHRYHFVDAGSGSSSPIRRFQIDSEFNKAWLPAARHEGLEAQSGEEGQEFLLDEPENRIKVTADTPTITLGELRRLVEAEQAEYEEGVDRHGKRTYRMCLYAKYRDLGRDSQVEYRRTDIRGVPSGLPRGTQILNEENYGITPQILSRSSVQRIEGRDAWLFSVEPVHFHTMRPIPQGVYRFFRWGYVDDPDDPVRPACGADILPEKTRRSFEYFVHVTAPDGTLHEAFFDPVDVGDAVGADGENGVLQPERFEAEGDETVIERIGWEDGRVEVELSPAADLAAHRMDFIALDGSVSLRLDFDDAVEFTDENDAATLTWGVCEQPWRDGDMLMLRIVTGVPSDGVQATSNPECLTATSELEPAATSEPVDAATPEPTPTPSEQGS